MSVRSNSELGTIIESELLGRYQPIYSNPTSRDGKILFSYTS